MKNLKVVLLHDWLVSLRGGERVFEVFCEMFPEAPIYTLVHVPGSTTKSIESHKITTSFLNSIPGIEEKYRQFLPLFPTAIEQMAIREKADLVLSSSHCVIKGLRRPEGAKHICYIHSPMRYIYDQFNNYFGPGRPLTQRLAAHLVRPYLQTWDKISNDNVDLFVANSEFVRKRIRHFYHRDSIVVNPFVELDDFKAVQNSPEGKESYYLMVTAFAPNKRVDLAINAFNELRLPLKIVGSGQEAQRLKLMANDNIQFLGHVGRGRIIDLMAKAKGFIFPGVEDFGITPLEAMAALTPVIAFAAGGVLETLNEKVGTFFHEANKKSLIEAVKKNEEKDFHKEDFISQVSQYSKNKFIEQMHQVISHTLNIQNHTDTNQSISI